MIGRLLKPVCLWIALTVSLVSWGQGRTTDLYFVRHGETEANATGHYNGTTINSFSALGLKMVESLPARLANVNFDIAICSPSPRALKTAAPILKAKNMKAEIWPEFNECCTQVGKARKLPPHANSLRTVGGITAPAAITGYFVLVPGHDKMIADGNYQDGMIVTRAAVARFKGRFSHTGRSILVIGHSGQGARFLELMLGKEPVGRMRPDNASIYHLREDASGKWTLVSISNFKRR